MSADPASPTLAGLGIESSAISTAKLKALPPLHVRPIEQVVYLRPYLVNPVGDLILGRASHLDAFSAYPYRTSATQQCSWQNNWHTGGPSTLVLSYWGQPPSNPLRPRRIETELSHDVLNPARVPL